jgi:hypothetical protein
LTADLDLLAIWKRMVERSPSDTVTCFENENTGIACFEITGCSQPGEPSADHHYVDVQCHRLRFVSVRAGPTPTPITKAPQRRSPFESVNVYVNVSRATKRWRFNNTGTVFIYPGSPRL